MQVKDITDWQVLQHVPYYGTGRPIDALEATGVPYKVALRKVERLDFEHLDWGTSIHWVWLTDKGRDYKRQLELQNTPGLTEAELDKRIQQDREAWERETASLIADWGRDMWPAGLRAPQMG